MWSNIDTHCHLSLIQLRIRDDNYVEVEDVPKALE